MIILLILIITESQPFSGGPRSFFFLGHKLGTIPYKGARWSGSQQWARVLGVGAVWVSRLLQRGEYQYWDPHVSPAK